MWRLWNKLFGWDYVLVSWAYSYLCRRVHRGQDGVEFVKAYGEIIVRGRTLREWIPLTYKIDK